MKTFWGRRMPPRWARQKQKPTIFNPIVGCFFFLLGVLVFLSIMLLWLKYLA